MRLPRARLRSVPHRDLKMGWPINIGETMQPEARPSWQLWAALFVCLIGASVAWAVWSWPSGKPVDARFWLRSATPLLVGCVLLGLWINRYDQSVAASVANEEATENTRLQWQQWAQRALRVVACAAITPECALVAAMTSVPPTAAASPHKGRTFHGWPDGDKIDPLQWALEQLARQLDEIHPNWSTQVQSIHVQADADAAHIERAWQDAQSVWTQRPSTANVVPLVAGDWNDMFDEPNASPRLFVAVQTWPSSREPRDFSELAVALLVSGDHYPNHSLATPALRIGRPMATSAETLDADLAMLFDYAGADRTNVAGIWLTGISADASGAMSNMLSPSEAEAVPSYPVDHYLARAHTAQYWFGLVAAAEACRQGNGNPQLAIAHAENGLTVHLIAASQTNDHLAA